MKGEKHEGKHEDNKVIKKYDIKDQRTQGEVESQAQRQGKKNHTEIRSGPGVHKTTKRYNIKKKIRGGT